MVEKSASLPMVEKSASLPMAKKSASLPMAKKSASLPMVSITHVTRLTSRITLRVTLNYPDFIQIFTRNRLPSRTGKRVQVYNLVNFTTHFTYACTRLSGLPNGSLRSLRTFFLRASDDNGTDQ